MAKILFVEDDMSLIQGLKFAIEKTGHEVITADTKEKALKRWRNENVDLVILDVMLPDGNGYDICREIRKESAVPIIFLTARDDEIDITRGLDMGGDDYISKPFKLSVLMSRISAILRRCNNLNQTHECMQSAGIVINQMKGEVYKGDEQIFLSSGEYKLLKYFIQNKDRVLSADQILSNLWDCDGRFIDSGTLTVYIRRLRKKIEDDPSDPVRITTVRGMGYIWNSEVDR